MVFPWINHSLRTAAAVATLIAVPMGMAQAGPDGTSSQLPKDKGGTERVLVARLAPVATEPVRLVNKWHALLTDAMHSEAPPASSLRDAQAGQGAKARQARIKAGLEGLVDMEARVQRSAGDHWAKLDAAQRRRLVAADQRLLVALFAGSYRWFHDGQFAIKDQGMAPDGGVWIVTHMVDDKGDAHRVDYLARQGAQGWRIEDFIIDGRFSERTVREAEFEAILRRQGFEALVEALNAKAALLEARLEG